MEFLVTPGQRALFAGALTTALIFYFKPGYWFTSDGKLKKLCTGDPWPAINLFNYTLIPVGAGDCPGYPWYFAVASSIVLVLLFT